MMHTPTQTPRHILTIEEFDEWLADDKADDRVAYHVGVLMTDRLEQYVRANCRVKLNMRQQGVVNESAIALNRLAMHVAKLSEDGEVLLAQYNVSSLSKLYVAVKVTPTPPPPPAHHARVPKKYGKAAVAPKNQRARLSELRSVH